MRHRGLSVVVCRRRAHRAPRDRERAPIMAWLLPWDRALRAQNGYSSLRQLRGSSGCGFGVRSSSMLKKGATNGSGAITV
jgi:hypothetical protein